MLTLWSYTIRSVCLVRKPDSDVGRHSYWFSISISVPLSISPSHLFRPSKCTSCSRESLDVENLALAWFIPIIHAKMVRIYTCWDMLKVISVQTSARIPRKQGASLVSVRHPIPASRSHPLIIILRNCEMLGHRPARLLDPLTGPN